MRLESDRGRFLLVLLLLALCTAIGVSLAALPTDGAPHHAAAHRQGRAALSGPARRTHTP